MVASEHDMALLNLEAESPSLVLWAGLQQHQAPQWCSAQFAYLELGIEHPTHPMHPVHPKAFEL